MGHRTVGSSASGSAQRTAISILTMPAVTPSSAASKCALSHILSSPRSTPAISVSAPPANTNKNALSFILQHSPSSPLDPLANESASYPHSETVTMSAMRTADWNSSRSVAAGPQREILHDTKTPTTSSSATAIKKGPRFCVVDGCMSLAKHNKRCWRHGGSKKCKITFCYNRAKSKGVCWSHGGGTRCRAEKCGTTAVSKGFCWAHGGGKRCLTPHCLRPGYEHTQNYCAEHFRAMWTDRTPPIQCIL